MNVAPWLSLRQKDNEQDVQDFPPAKKTIAHLEGLRGLAIIMVVFFHCFTKFKNGYLGVDIFLVISGYLLFRSFWENYEAFSCRDFIIKKLQRLFPLAATVSILCCLVGLLLFPCDLGLKTAKAALSALVGCSNLYFDYTFSDYFASDAYLNPLVHTWYLSLIAQIYLIYACIALVCRKKCRKAKLALLTGIAIISFAIFYANIWMPVMFPLTYVASSYYWTSGRLWMVIAGGMAHHLPKRGNFQAIGAAAVLLLLAMGFSPYASPQFQELLVVSSTCLAIAHGGTAPTTYFLSLPMLRTIGKYSFSLYIIHWPVIVFGFYISEAYMGHVPAITKMAILLASAALSVILFHTIEKRKLSIRYCLYFITAGGGIAATLISSDCCREWVHCSVNAIKGMRYADTGACRVITQGTLLESLPSFRQEYHHAGFGAKQNIGETIPQLYEIGNHPEQADFLLMGDSHAEALYPGMDIVSKERGWNGVYLHTYVIPLINIFSEDKPPQRWDEEKAELLLEYLKINTQIKTVFIANFYDARFRNPVIDWHGERHYLDRHQKHYFTCLRAFIEKIHQLGKEVVIFADVPRMPMHDIETYVLRQKLYSAPINPAKLTCTQESYQKINGELNKTLKEWENEGLCRVLHPENVLLQSGSFCCFQENMLYYIDGHHLSVPGSVMCIQSLESELNDILVPDLQNAPQQPKGCLTK